jgi:hypothetical protein
VPHLGTVPVSFASGDFMANDIQRNIREESTRMDAELINASESPPAYPARSRTLAQASALSLGSPGMARVRSNRPRFIGSMGLTPDCPLLFREKPAGCGLGQAP